ncbi:MAG: biotin/lipoyl-binding protein [Alistipes sp.]|nr:biotin/lipoyl-binding protein [Candidatus Minthomonas equi]
MKEYKLKINGNDYNVTINDVEETVAYVEANGTPFKVEFEKPITKPKTITVINKPKSAAPAAPAVQVNKPAAAVPAGGNAVNSPLPGVVLEISCKDGEAVKQGQKILVLEAMKMENIIEAPADGTISYKVGKGDSVLEGAVLAVIA